MRVKNKFLENRNFFKDLWAKALVHSSFHCFTKVITNFINKHTSSFYFRKYCVNGWWVTYLIFKN